jgi:hypothetical protein
MVVVDLTEESFIRYKIKAPLMAGLSAERQSEGANLHVHFLYKNCAKRNAFKVNQGKRYKCFKTNSL